VTATTPVAVVMPCHNYGRYVAAALRSIADQTVIPVDVLVIDDGSTDDTAEVLAAVKVELASRLPIRVIHQSNRGLVRTLNDGVAATSAPYILFVSADDRARPELVEHLAAALDRHRTAGYAYPKMELFGGEHGVHLSYPFSPGRLIFDHNYIPGAAMARREAFEAAGGVRELTAHEDWDLWLSFLDAGWQGVFVPEVLYEWRRHATARNNQDVTTKLRLRLTILAGHPKLLVRYAYLAVPFTFSAVWRRIRVRIGPPPRYARTGSCWIEAGSDAATDVGSGGTVDEVRGDPPELR
jgi:glycosyltransferase involved in cell wall biosynthesis